MLRVRVKRVKHGQGPDNPLIPKRPYMIELASYCMDLFAPDDAGLSFKLACRDADELRQL